MQNELNQAYEAWRADPTKENMSRVTKLMRPLILSEINRYPGSNEILKGKSKKFAVDAVKDFDPAQGAKLTTWVVNRLQQLHRYGRKSKQIVNTSELAYRQFAELDARRREFLDEEGREPTDEELADMTGLSTKRINAVRQMNPVVKNVGVIEEAQASEDEGAVMPAVMDIGADPELNTALEAVYESATDRDKSILDFKTGRGGQQVLSNQEIAKRLGVSPGLVSQRSLELAQNIQDAYGI